MSRVKCFLLTAFAVAVVGSYGPEAFAQRTCVKGTSGTTGTTTNPFALSKDQRSQLRTALPTLGSAWFDFWKTANSTLTSTELSALRQQIGAQLATLRTATDWASYFSIWDTVYAQLSAAVTAKADATLTTKFTTLKAAYDSVKLIIVPITVG